MPEDPLADIARRIEEQTQEIRQLHGTIIWSVFFGTGAILLALFRPQLLVYLLITITFLALAAGSIWWCSRIGRSKIRGKPVGGLALILLVIVLAVSALWTHF